MLTKRIIPCLDVRDGKVVKGVKFKGHEVLGDIESFAKMYSDAGADELVFYDITASSDQRVVDCGWVERVAALIDIPFCVAGGISSVEDAGRVLRSGADKVSINSPALVRPELISELAERFGRQCVVVGVDSMKEAQGYMVWQYTGREETAKGANLSTEDWIRQADKLGAGEFVLNCMNQDGVKSGYDIDHLRQIRRVTNRPIIASGGAGKMEHFAEVFKETNVDGALAASVFHKNVFSIGDLKKYLISRDFNIRASTSLIV